jgi:hypothetical protein
VGKLALAGALPLTASCGERVRAGVVSYKFVLYQNGQARVGESPRVPGG